MQSAEQGHFSLSIDSKKFDFVASFKNMAKLADAERLIILFDLIHSVTVPVDSKINTAREILLACVDDQLLDKYLIQCKKRKPLLRKHQISANDQIVVAAALMRHGIAGVNAPKFAGSKKKGKPLKEFDVYKYVADAKQYFGMSLNEAWNLTMTEFRYHLAAAFPPEKKEDDAPSLDEHIKSMRGNQKIYEKALASLGGE